MKLHDLNIIHQQLHPGSGASRDFSGISPEFYQRSGRVFLLETSVVASLRTSPLSETRP